MYASAHVPLPNSSTETLLQVTDARATMAIYRLHRKQWERGYAVVPIRIQRKLKANDEAPGRTRSSREPPGTPHASETRAGTTTQRKGISSGMSTVVQRPSTTKDVVDGTKKKWWTVLTGTGEDPKGSIRVTM